LTVLFVDGDFVLARQQEIHRRVIDAHSDSSFEERMANNAITSVFGNHAVCRIRAAGCCRDCFVER
jgi:hypothetical protein